MQCYYRVWVKVFFRSLRIKKNKYHYNATDWHSTLFRKSNSLIDDWFKEVFPNVDLLAEVSGSNFSFYEIGIYKK